MVEVGISRNHGFRRKEKATRVESWGTLMFKE